MDDIFISYSRKDIAFAHILNDMLKSKGLESWIDWQDIPPTADWLAEVYTAIESVNTFVFICHLKVKSGLIFNNLKVKSGLNIN